MRANPLSGRRSRRDRAQLIDPVGDALRGFAKLLDAPVRCVTSGHAVSLTATEYELLRVLALDARRVLTYETLLRRVWGPRNGDDAHLVRIFVKTLRGKTRRERGEAPNGSSTSAASDTAWPSRGRSDDARRAAVSWPPSREAAADRGPCKPSLWHTAAEPIPAAIAGQRGEPRDDIVSALACAQDGGEAARG